MAGRCYWWNRIKQKGAFLSSREITCKTKMKKKTEFKHSLTVAKAIFYAYSYLARKLKCLTSTGMHHEKIEPTERKVRRVKTFH